MNSDTNIILILKKIYFIFKLNKRILLLVVLLFLYILNKLIFIIIMINTNIIIIKNQIKHEFGDFKKIIMTRWIIFKNNKK